MFFAGVCPLCLTYHSLYSFYHPAQYHTKKTFRAGCRQSYLLPGRLILTLDSDNNFLFYIFFLKDKITFICLFITASCL